MNFTKFLRTPFLREHLRWLLLKTKITTYGDKVYTTFRDLNVPENGIECESFTSISIDSLLFCDNKYCLQIHLDNCVYKITDKQMIDYLDGNLFESDENYLLIIY